MKKISILALHLGHGGVEKAISSLANALKDNYEIEIACIYKGKIAFPLDEKIKIKYLLGDLKENRNEFNQALKQGKLITCFKEGLKSFKILYYRHFKMIQYIKNCDADVIISSRIMFHRKLSKYGSANSIKIAQEHRHHNNEQKYIEKLEKSLYNIDYLMPVSLELTKFYQEKFNIKCIYIPHFLDEFPSEPAKLNTKKIISVGRLSPEKGYLDLIDVMNLVFTKHNDWTLDIIGNGTEYSKIKEKINILNLDNNIKLHGFQSKDYINNLYQNASIFCMASLEESFGLVLIEASSFGIPAVVFDSATGFKEIIKNNQTGFLIPNRDKKKMADKIIELIEDENLRNEIGKKGRKNTYQYSNEKIKKQWLEFLERSI